jgi:hypothetical protein
MLRYFNTFKMSRNPFTICWLLEVLKLLSLKFAMHESKLDNRLKKEYHDLFNSMLINFSSIITDTFNIQFHETQQYHIAFPPSIYEMLWRYEYISFKHTIHESHDDSNSLTEQQQLFDKAINNKGSSKADSTSKS